MTHKSRSDKHVYSILQHECFRRKQKQILSYWKYFEDVIYIIQAFISTTEAHKLEMINRVGLFSYVADFTEEPNFYEFKALACIAAQKPQKKKLQTVSLSFLRIFQILNGYFT